MLRRKEKGQGLETNHTPNPEPGPSLLHSGKAHLRGNLLA